MWKVSIRKCIQPEVLCSVFDWFFCSSVIIIQFVSSLYSHVSNVTTLARERFQFGVYSIFFNWRHPDGTVVFCIWLVLSFVRPSVRLFTLFVSSFYCLTLSIGHLLIEIRLKIIQVISSWEMGIIMTMHDISKKLSRAFLVPLAYFMKHLTLQQCGLLIFYLQSEEWRCTKPFIANQRIACNNRLWQAVLSMSQLT